MGFTALNIKKLARVSDEADKARDDCLFSKGLPDVFSPTREVNAVATIAWIAVEHLRIVQADLGANTVIVDTSTINQVAGLHGCPLVPAEVGNRAEAMKIVTDCYDIAVVLERNGCLIHRLFVFDGCYFHFEPELVGSFDVGFAHLLVGDIGDQVLLSAVCQTVDDGASAISGLITHVDVLLQPLQDSAKRSSCATRTAS